MRLFRLSKTKGVGKLAYIPIEDLMNNAQDSIYKLVILASRRALELGAGSEKLVDTNANTKLTSIAFREIKEKKISYKVKEK